MSPTLGLHSVNVFFAGQPIPNSPFGVRVSAGELANLNFIFRHTYFTYACASCIVIKNNNDCRFVNVAVSDPKKVRASGRGLQPKGVRVKDVADFKIYTEGAGEGTPEVRIIGPGKIYQQYNNRYG